MLETLALLQQQSGGGGQLIAMVIQLVFTLVGLGIAIFILLFLSNCFKALPEEHQSMNPNLVWLMLVPCVNIVWQFFVLPGLAKSFKSYFDSKGVTDVEDCGEKLAWITCILTLIPCVNIIGLVCMIIYLLKMNELKKRVEAGA